MTEINLAKNKLADKRILAAQAVIDHLRATIQPSDIIGIGTGATVEIFIQLLAKAGLIFSHCVASSQRSAVALTQAGLIQHPIAQCNTVDFYIDGIDEGLVNGITLKGGGGALAREKVLASLAKTFITMADQQRQVTQLGKFALPIEILPAAQSSVNRTLIKLGGSPHKRENFITDNGNIIIDVSGLDLHDPETMETCLNNIAGIVENGIFAHRRADFMAFAHDKGVKWIIVDKLKPK